MYDPTLFVPADEADSKAITHLEVIGNDLGVWKETKTGVVLNRDMESEVVWRDRKIGAPAQGCVSMLTERQAVVLCHDGQVRIFDGTGYDHSMDLADARLAPISEPVRTVTEALVPVGSAAIGFVWHREKLHLLYSSSGVRKALQLLPRYGYGWMPWEFSEDSHLMNASAEGDSKWVFITSAGTVWEQSPLAGATLDRDTYTISWRSHEVLFPKNRRSLLRVEGCYVEGTFDVLTQASFVLNEGEATTAAVLSIPDTGVPKALYARWFGLRSATEIRARCVGVILEGAGAMTRRALAFDALEEPALGVPGTPAAKEDLFAYLPTYTAPMVAYIRFDSAASTTQRDFSGNARNLTWQGGTYSTLASMSPYGGVSADAGANDGFAASGTWDGMDYLGDDAGENSVPQTWEAVLYRIGSGVSYLERALRDATGETWEISIQADGSLRFDLYADARKWRWTTAAGVIPASGAYTAPYVLQAVLFDTGNQMRLWCGPATGALAEVTLTRAVLGAASGWAGNWNIGYQSALGISHFRRLVRLREEPEARAFHNLIRSLM